MKNIKWACIQPLTGGAYLGAELAIGHSAEWIMSFKGLDSVQYDNNNNMTNVGNEYNLLEYLKKKNRSVPYYVINHKMFDIDIENTNPNITLNNNESIPNYDDLDIVIGVPVCSGLSIVTKASDETKNARNCNMQWMTYYSLSTIKPKIFIFENAPTLMGDRGIDLRNWFNDIAKQFGYSILYYKTDTVLHNNCQKRPRTFVLFIKHNDDSEIQNPPIIGYEENSVTIEEFLKRIPEGLTQQIPIKTGPYNNYVLDFMHKKYGDSWKEIISGEIMKFIIKNNLLDELISYIENDNKYSLSDKEKSLKYITHIKYKKSLGKNYYGDDIQYVKQYMPSIQFRSMPNMLHLYEDRIYTIREYLSFMGMPYDFELYGNESNFPKIGQNVPVGTTHFIVKEAVKIIEKWEDKRPHTENVIYQNNINQKIIEL